MWSTGGHASLPAAGEVQGETGPGGWPGLAGQWEGIHLTFVTPVGKWLVI